MLDTMRTTAADYPFSQKFKDLMRWIKLGILSTVFLRIDLNGEKASPLTIVWLLVMTTTAVIAAERLMVETPAIFYWEAINGGWLLKLLSLLLCWQVTRLAAVTGQRIQLAALFAVTLVQDTVFYVIGTISNLLMAQVQIASSVQTWVYPAISLWAMFAYWLLLSRVAKTNAKQILLIGLCSAGFSIYNYQYPATWYWYTAADENTYQSRNLNQDILEQQMAVAKQQRDALLPGKAGVVELYSIGFSPYGDEDVFWRESSMVTQLMQKRFGAAGHSQLLVNNPSTHSNIAWASNLNLERAIDAAAGKMNKDEDILFIYMTSHGGRDQKLSSSNWPLHVDPLTPALLDGMLKKAGIQYRVIAISACYSGSWIAPLRDDYAMIMTAADSEHTSYGCGSRSTLTFFGRAVFDEALRSTYSFQQAFATAVPVIRKREIEVGKEDGFSNPQLYSGKYIQGQLELLQRRLEKDASSIQ